MITTARLCLEPYDSGSLGLPPGQTVLEKYFGYADWLNGEAR